jgi:hypothetical protein
MNGTSPGAIYRNIQTQPGQPYLLRFAHAGNPDTNGFNPKTMDTFWQGGRIASNWFDTTGHDFNNMGWVYTNLTVFGSGGLDELRFASTTSAPGKDQYGPTLDDVSLTLLGTAEANVGGRNPIQVTGSTNWQVATIPFTALGPNTSFDIQGIDDGLIIDTVVLTEAGGPYFVQPEDPFGLSGLTGTSARGSWQLEVWDNRVGPPITDTNNGPKLLSWDLSFVFATPKPAPADLVDDVGSTNIVAPGHIRYFVVQVPSWARFATNNLIFATAPGVNLWFNQNGLPRNGILGDTLLQGPNSTGGIVTLAAASGTPPLVPGSTYYLGVENTSVAPLTFALQVNFDITPLTLNVPTNSVAGSNDPPHYFSYDVTGGETAVTFALTNLSGDVNLVVSKGVPFPVPGASDYGSFNPGTNNEEVIVFTNSEPVVLGPGRWYLGVYNNTSPVTNVTYTVVVTDMTNAVPLIIDLFNKVPYTNYNTGVPPFNIDYYHYVVSTNAIGVQFELTNATAPMQFYVNRGLPLPDPAVPGSYIYSSGLGPNDVVSIFQNSTPPVGPGDWFISAVNPGGGPVNYGIVAIEYPLNQPIIITNEFLSTSNSFCLTWTSLPGVPYWVGGMTNIMQGVWTNVSPTIPGTGFLTTWCLPLPSQWQFFRVFQGFAPGPPAPPFSLIGIPKPAAGAAMFVPGGTQSSFVPGAPQSQATQPVSSSGSGP